MPESLEALALFATTDYYLLQWGQYFAKIVSGNSGFSVVTSGFWKLEDLETQKPGIILHWMFSSQ